MADLKIARRLRKYVSADGGRLPHFLEGTVMETGRRRLSDVARTLLDFEQPPSLKAVAQPIAPTTT
jgi:hypothetical protein